MNMKRSAPFLLSLFPWAFPAYAAGLKVGDPAPQFSATTHDGKSFELESRRGKGWTVLFFYPKAGTPGCTKQACAFRDSVKKIRNQNAEVFGVSADSVSAQAKFHKEHNLGFDLIADEKLDLIEKYGVKIPVIGKAKRQTFIVDPDLKIRWHAEDVDPALDADRVSAALAEMQKGR